MDECISRRLPRVTSDGHRLTRREVEVLALIAEGLCNPEIAERLYLTPKTVSHHLTTIFSMPGVTERIGAVRAATKLGVTTEN